MLWHWYEVLGTGHWALGNRTNTSTTNIDCGGSSSGRGKRRKSYALGFGRRLCLRFMRLFLESGLTGIQGLNYGGSRGLRVNGP